MERAFLGRAGPTVPVSQEELLGDALRTPPQAPAPPQTRSVQFVESLLPTHFRSTGKLSTR